MKPSTDREAVSLIIDGLIERGVTIRTARDGENEDMHWTGSNKEEFLAHLMSCDEGVLFVSIPEDTNTAGNTFVYFVYGNEPMEVASDYGVSLSEYFI